jgi:hypothetical protein
VAAAGSSAIHVRDRGRGGCDGPGTRTLQDHDVSIMAGTSVVKPWAPGGSTGCFNLVPVALGSGKPFFAAGGTTEPVMLANPRVIEGDA